MDAVIIHRISEETAIQENSVSAAVDLFEKGATGPFVVRYRKEATGGLDETRVRLIQERMDYYREVRDRKVSLLKSLSDQGILTDEIKERIRSCVTKVELDDLNHRFRSRKKARSSGAIEKGLGPLAEYFLNQEPDAWSMEEHIQVFVEASRNLSTPEEALRGVVDILAERIGETPEYRRTLREMLEKDGFVISSVVPAKVNQKTKYTMYYERRESVTTIPSHRVLAIRRGCKEGILISSIEGDHTRALEFLLESVIKDRESFFAPVLEAAVRESYNRILRPLAETEVRSQLKERADREAIMVFQENLTNLLLSPPAGPIVTMGVDWGKNNECSVAVVDKDGSFIEGTKVRFTPSGKSQNPGREKTSPKEEEKENETAGTQQSAAESTSPSAENPPGNGQNAPGSSPDSSKPVIGKENVPAEDLSAPDSPDADPPGTEESSALPAVGTGSDSGKGTTAGQPDEQQASRPDAVSEPEGISKERQEKKNVEEADPNPQDPPENGSAAGSDLQEESSEQPPSETDPVTAETSVQSESGTGEQPTIKEPDGNGQQQEQAHAVLSDTPQVTPLDASAGKPAAAADAAAPPSKNSVSPENTLSGPETVREKLKDMIIRHKVRAISIGAGTRARELEVALRRILTDDNSMEGGDGTAKPEEKSGDIMIAAVNDAGIAIYSSSRIAREEFPDWNPSLRCAVSLARRLQDPLSELVKIDPKLIGVGQYQHDVDQKELHRKLLRTVQYCVNKVGVNVNTAKESLLRYVSGLNDKIARRITAYRSNAGAFPSRESIPSSIGMDSTAYEQAAAFLRIPDGENRLDRTAIHPESYPVVQQMARTLGMDANELVGDREKINSLKLEDYITDTAGLPTLKNIREELYKPGRDPRKPFKLPKFRSDVTSMSELKTGMTLEGTVTNVTNFGAFVDIGVQQDGLVHLSQMSNRFIRDPREAVKVGDIVQVKVISVEAETRRIGLSMKALMPAVPKRRRKQQRHSSGQRRTEKKPAHGKDVGSTGTATSTPEDKAASPKGRSKQNRPHPGSSRARKRGERKPEKAEGPKPKKETAPEEPERSLQEKIAILQTKFRRIN